MNLYNNKMILIYKIKLHVIHIGVYMYYKIMFKYND